MAGYEKKKQTTPLMQIIATGAGEKKKISDILRSSGFSGKEKNGSAWCVEKKAPTATTGNGKMDFLSLYAPGTSCLK